MALIHPDKVDEVFRQYISMIKARQKFDGAESFELLKVIREVNSTGWDLRKDRDSLNKDNASLREQLDAAGARANAYWARRVALTRADKTLYVLLGMLVGCGTTLLVFRMAVML